MIDVANFGNIIRLSDMECCAFIKHLVIGFANNGNTLKLPKMECFSVLKSPHLATFGLALKLPITGPETYLPTLHTNYVQYIATHPYL